MASRELNILIKAKDLASGAIKGVKSELGGLQSIGRKAGYNLGRNFERGVVAAGAGLAAGATFAITTAASFEQAEAGIRKTVEGSTGQVDDLIAKVREMSRTVPLSFEELAAIAAEGGALGISTGALDEFTEIIARLGVSTDLTVDQAATAFGQLANVLQMDESDMQSFGDMLVALGNDGASTESQILDLTARFGAAGNSAGLSNAEIMALASTTASMGIEAEAGGGALSRVFNQITQDIALVSGESEVLADVFGISMAELRTRWDRDAGGVFEDLLGHLNELDQFGKAELLSDLGITNTRDVNAIMLLSQGVEEYQRQLGVANDATGALDKESDAFFNTTQGKWETLKNNVRLAADMVGRELLPVVNDLIADFVDWLTLDTTQAGIKQFAQDFAQHARDIATWLKSLDWNAIGNAMKTAAGAGKAILDAFLAMPPWVQQLLAGGFAVNKLTGGALGDLIGLVGKGVIKGVMNMNAGVVNINAGAVRGGPGGVPAGGAGAAGLLGPAAIAAAALAALTIIGTEVSKTVNPTAFNFNELAGQTGASRVQVEGDLLRLSSEMGVSVDTLRQRMIPLLESGNRTWGEVVNQIRTGYNTETSATERAEAAIRDATPWLQRNQQEIHNLNASEANRHSVKLASERYNSNQQLAKQAEALGVVRAQSGTLEAIKNKKSTVHVTANISPVVNISLQSWERRRISQANATTISTLGGGI